MKKRFVVPYWFLISWDTLVDKNRKTTGAVVRFRWIKWRQRQWNLEFYRA